MSAEKAIAKIAEGLNELFEAAQGLSNATPDEAEAEASDEPVTNSDGSKRRKKGSKKKGKAKKAKAAEATGPSIDDVRKVCMDLVETVDEYGDEDDDGNDTLVDLINAVDEEAEGRLSNLEGNGDALTELVAKVKTFLEENYPEDDDD